MHCQTGVLDWKNCIWGTQLGRWTYGTECSTRVVKQFHPAHSEQLLIENLSISLSISVKSVTCEGWRDGAMKWYTRNKSETTRYQERLQVNKSSCSIFSILCANKILWATSFSAFTFVFSFPQDYTNHCFGWVDLTHRRSNTGFDPLADGNDSVT